MIQEESRIMLQAGAGGLLGVKSALAVSNPGTGPRGETRECYNCGEVGHLKQACKKPLKDKTSGGRGQIGGRGRGRGGRRGGRGGYQAHLTVAEGDDEGSVNGVGFSEKDKAFLDVLLTMKQKAEGDGKNVVDGASTSFSSRGNFASFAHSVTSTCDTLALASISTTRSPDWIVDSGASRHVTGAAREFSSYNSLTVLESIQTADGTAQPVVGKGDLSREGDR